MTRRAEPHPYAQLLDEVEADLADLPSDASISVRLAHEAARELELQGKFQLAAEVIARALADEAQRINQSSLHNLDLSDENEAYQSRNVYHAMLQQRANAQALRKLRLRQQTQQGTPPVLLRCFAGVAARAGGELPTPTQTLEDLAARWHLPDASVQRLWGEFIEASGGEYTLSLGRACKTFMRHVTPEVQSATWSFILLDTAAAELVDSTEDAGGACGLNFEEYLVFRSFEEAEALEDQFRFLWALFDRDGDGLLSREELRAALQVQRARLGWDDAYTQGWVSYIFDCVPHEPRGIRHTALLKELRQWAELRQVLMAREPRDSVQPAQATDWVKSVFDLFGL
eukprot:scaffold309881_cov30-Tisochrysis_lutea.AAC.1